MDRKVFRGGGEGHLEVGGNSRQMPRQPLPAYTAPLESRLRARAMNQPSPVDSLPPRVRGLKAAAAVLSGDMSAAEALKLFQVSPDSLKYYKRRLSENGWEVAASSASPTSDVLTSKESDCSSYSTAWNEYCLAYIYAGQLVAECRGNCMLSC
ncbi:hypothetical protein AB1Y20_004563 [Prymnesium parvum]|uniref:Uncharacterized protein n=1 Tax=Prymnesium parvum TaxID=97485 RepID=A0AB34IZ37_PRYPA